MPKSDSKDAMSDSQEPDIEEKTTDAEVSEHGDEASSARQQPSDREVAEVEVEALRRGVAASIESLADSIAEVMKRMRASERRQNLNSFAAYTLFTILLGGGFALLYQSRVGSLAKARDDAVAERDASRARAVELQNEIGRRDAAAEAAYEYYTLMRDKRRTEVLAGFARVEQLALTPAEREFFTAGLARAKSEMVDAGYLAGLDAFRRGDFSRAIKELERALGYEVEGGQAALIRYYLGVSQHKVDDNDAGIRNLELALAGGVEQAGISDARFHLGAAFESVGSLNEARKEYSKFVSSSPRSPLAPVARRKVAMLARQIALAGARDGANPVVAPAPVAPGVGLRRAPAPARAGATPPPAAESPTAAQPAAKPKPAGAKPVSPAAAAKPKPAPAPKPKAAPSDPAPAKAETPAATTPG